MLLVETEGERHYFECADCIVDTSQFVGSVGGVFVVGGGFVVCCGEFCAGGGGWDVYDF